jgi:Ni/Co efflux regulator RcnB
VLADYWLFALEVPPAGYEWVRDNTDALLVSTQTGEILQVEYGVFA